MRKGKKDFENGNSQNCSEAESGNLHHMKRKGRTICFDTFPIWDEVNGEEKYGTSTWLKMKALVERTKLCTTNMSNSQGEPEPIEESDSSLRIHIEKEELCAQCQLRGYYLGGVHACQGIVSAMSDELPTIQNECPEDSSKKHNDVISKNKIGKDKVVYIDLEDDMTSGVISKTKTGKDKVVFIDLEDDDMANADDEFADF